MAAIARDGTSTGPKLLGPDYFKTKLIAFDDEEKASTPSITSLLQATAVPRAQPGKSIASHSAGCVTSSMWRSNRTRTTPAAEAAMKREQENRKKRQLIKMNSGAAVCAMKTERRPQSSMPSDCVAARDCAEEDWVGWTLNELDSDDPPQPATKPAVGAGRNSSSCLTSTKPDMLANSHHSSVSMAVPGTPSSSVSMAVPGTPSTSVSMAVPGTPSSSVSMAVPGAPSSSVPGGSLEPVATGELEELVNDKVMADLLQGDEYGEMAAGEYGEMAAGEDWSYNVARIYQEDLDAVAAQELQRQATASGVPVSVSVRRTSVGTVSSPTTGQVVGGVSETREHTRQSCQQATCGDQGRLRDCPAHNMDMSYEALVDLEDVACGLDKDSLDQCTNTRSYKEIEGMSIQNKTCSVCLTSLKESQLVRYLPCLHYFHCHCIDQWLQSHSTCPVCMKDIKELFMTMT